MRVLRRRLRQVPTPSGQRAHVRRQEGGHPGAVRLYRGRPEVIERDSRQFKGEAGKLPPIPKAYDVANRGKFSPGQCPTHKDDTQGEIPTSRLGNRSRNPAGTGVSTKYRVPNAELRGSTGYQYGTQEGVGVTQHFKDLVAWQKAMDLVEQIYRLTEICQCERITACPINSEGRQYRLPATLRKDKRGIRRRSLGIFTGRHEVL